MPSISPASSSDLDAIVSLLDTVALPHEDLTHETLRSFWVLRGENAVYGVVGLEPVGSDALLRSLAVHPSVQGRGHGRTLVREAESHGRGFDLDHLYLLTTSAAGFFEGLGYERIDREAVPPTIEQTAEFSRLCPTTATCMQKPLIS